MVLKTTTKVKMVYLGKLELCSVILISLVAYSVGSQNSIDDLHNQLNDNQQVSRLIIYKPYDFIRTIKTFKIQTNILIN